MLIQSGDAPKADAGRIDIWARGGRDPAK